MRREKALVHSGMKDLSGNWIAPPGSNRSGGGDTKAAGAAVERVRIRRLGESVGRNVSERRAGPETVDAGLYAFHGGADGNLLNSDLAMDAAGVLYGTTWFGGDAGCTYGCALVFKISRLNCNFTIHGCRSRPSSFATINANRK